MDSVYLEVKGRIEETYNIVAVGTLQTDRRNYLGKTFLIPDHCSVWEKQY